MLLNSEGQFLSLANLIPLDIEEILSAISKMERQKRKK